MLAEATLRELQRLTEYCEIAAAFDGRPRQRLIAIADAEELYFRRYPYHYRALQVVRVSAQLCKDAAEVGGASRCEHRIVSLLLETIRSGVRAGDLDFPVDRRAEELAFALWAFAFGVRALMNSGVAHDQLGVSSALTASRSWLHLLLDAVGWRPLSHECDYEGIRIWVRQAVAERFFGDNLAGH